MKHYITFLTIALAATVACSKQEVLSESPVDASGVELVPMTFTASCEEIVPRASLSADTNPQVVWAEGDQLAVYDGSAIRTFTIKAGEGGKTTAEFEGSAADVATYTAVFPYAAAYVEAGVLKYTVPAAQNVGTQSVDPAALVATATSTDKANFNFTSAVGLLRFDVPAGVTRAIFHTKGKTETLAGDSHAVVVTLSGTAGTFEAAVEPGTYEGIRAFVRTTSGDFVKNGASDLVITAGHLKPMGNIKTDTEVNVIETADELVSYLGGSPTLDGYICADLDMTAKSVTTCATYANVFDGQYHSISNWTSAGVSLFDTNTGTIKNFTLNSSCSLSLPSPCGQFGFVVVNSPGTVSGITNNADVTGTDITFSTNSARIGIIVGQAKANPDPVLVADCVNNGNFTITIDSNTVGTQIIGCVVGSLDSSEDNELRDCVNNGNMSITCSGTNTKNFYIGGVAGCTYNNSQNIRLVNNGDVSFSAASHDAALIMAGISSYTTGTVTDCENNGDITFTSGGALKATFVSGIAGYFGYATMSGTVNRGDVSVTAGYIKGRNGIGDISSAVYVGTDAISAGLTVGGLVSATAKNPVFSSSHNYGAVSLTLNDPANAAVGTHTAARPSVGGLVGDCSGPMTGCNNYGDVSVNIDNGGTSFTAKNAGYTLYVGGLVGSSYNWCGASTSGGSDKNKFNKFALTNCNNSGAVNVHTDNAHTTNHAVGGICGWPQSEDATAVYVATNCANSGNVTFSGNAKVRIGGVHGGTGRMDGCSNTGIITFQSGQNGSVAGSVAAFHSQGHTFTNCSAGGSVVANAAMNGIGGLVGNLGNVALTVTNCTVNCTITGASNAAGKNGLIVGYFNGTSKAITLGSSENPIKVKGTVDGVAITDANYTDYLYGTTGYAPAAHTIYAAYGD